MAPGMVNVYRVHWFSREEMIAKDLSFKDTCFSSLFPPVFGPRTETQIKQHQQHWLHCGVYIYIYIYIYHVEWMNKNAWSGIHMPPCSGGPCSGSFSAVHGFRDPVECPYRFLRRGLFSFTGSTPKTRATRQQIVARPAHGGTGAPGSRRQRPRCSSITWGRR